MQITSCFWLAYINWLAFAVFATEINSLEDPAIIKSISVVNYPQIFSDTILAFDVNYQIAANDTLNLLCQFDSEIEWILPNNYDLVNYSNPLTDGRLQLEYSNPFKTTFEARLTIKNLTSSDTGFYICASKSIGSNITQLAYDDQQNPDLGINRLYVFVHDANSNNLFLRDRQQIKYHRINSSTTSFIPCRVTHWDAVVKLNTSWGWTTPLYDRRRGFTFEMNMPAEDNKAFAICYATHSAQTDYYTVEYVVDGYAEKPVVTKSTEVPQLNGDLELTCSLPKRLDKIICIWDWPAKEKCRRKYDPKLERYNETQDSDQKRSVLRIKRLQPVDSGNYSCYCTDEAGQYRSSTTVVTITIDIPAKQILGPNPPTIQTINATVGQKAEIRVEFSAIPKSLVSYYWEHRYRSPWNTTEQRELISSWANLAKSTTDAVDMSWTCNGSSEEMWEMGEFQAYISLENLTLNRTGTYALMITVGDDIRSESTVRLNVFSPAEAQVSITAIDRPEATVLDGRFLELDQSYVISCIGRGYPLPRLNLEWSPSCGPTGVGRSGWLTADVSSDNIDRVDVHYGDFESVYSIVTRAKVTGTYRCTTERNPIVIHVHYTVTDVPDAQVNRGIYADLLVTSSPADDGRVYVGDRVVANCRTQKFAYDSVEWSPKNDNNYRTQYDWSNEYSNNLRLLFDEVSAEHEGNYTCVGRAQLNGDRTASIERTVELRVFEPIEPSFGDRTSNTSLEGNFSQSIEILCQTFGQPTPVVEWLKDGQELGLRPGVSIRKGNVLSISRLIKTDQGVYTCLVRNKGGRRSKDFALTVLNAPSDPSTTSRILVWALPVAILVLIVLIILLIFIFVLKRRNKRQVQMLRQLHHQLMISTQMTWELDPNLPINDQLENLVYDLDFEIPSDLLILGDLLGVGQFGKVYACTINSRDESPTINAAAKVPRDGMNIDHQRSLLSELKMMIYIGEHVNVLRLIGAVTSRMMYGQLYVVVERCDLGSLREYLLKQRSTFVDQIAVSNRSSVASGYLQPDQLFKTRVSIDQQSVLLEKTPSLCTADLISYGFQIANGMEYLSEKNLIHRDLALRNILLTGEHVVKISDFGLARCDDTYYIKSSDVPLPVKWMALESITDRKFTVQSDVWSMGVVLWELFSLGETPYANRSIDEDFIKWLEDGNRLEQPQYSTDSIYRLMEQCWLRNPPDRPSFADCRDRLNAEMKLVPKNRERSAAHELPIPAARSCRSKNSVDSAASERRHSIRPPLMPINSPLHKLIRLSDIERQRVSLRSTNRYVDLDTEIKA